ncbi:HI1506-related protein [Gluconobacter japonicus]|uniref:HI1506-related protein n=1 Tax=Gluconobacter japonicus TaxID=376620 RepID=UPI003D265BA5
MDKLEGKKIMEKEKPEDPKAETPSKAKPPAKVLGHVLTKGHSIKLHEGDIVITCAEPGFRRAGLEHPHMKVHPEGSLTEAQLKLLRAEPKISVIEIGD